MKYKLFISDYDGTLGKAPANDVDKETRLAIDEYAKKGGIFCVCTGRETSSIIRILNEQNLKGIVVSFQGAVITDLDSGKTLLDAGLSLEQTVKALDSASKYDLTPLCYGKNDFFYQQMNGYIEVYERAIRLKGKVADVKSEVIKNGTSVFKICWLGDDKIVKQAEKELNEIYKGQGIKFNSGAPCLLEAINPTFSKGKAVKYLADYYGIPLKEVIAVGDSTNDIDLITGEWHGVAVGDGREELKAVADEVTVPFDEKPIKYLLEKYCL